MFGVWDFAVHGFRGLGFRGPGFPAQGVEVQVGGFGVLGMCYGFLSFEVRGFGVF